MNYAEPYVIAEIGCNHAGDIDTAKKMISIAKNFCEVDAVKFQKRHNKTLLTAEQYRAPHPNPVHSFGATYGEHRERLEFTIEQHIELIEHCTKEGIEYSTSVWDLPSAREVSTLNPRFIKVPSATNLNFDLLELLCREYAGEIHISLGMTTPEETQQIANFLRERGRIGDCVIYACTSGYPVPFDQLALREIEKLQRVYGDQVRAVGFSGHHLGIAADVAAMTLGARVIERHFTLDRTAKGTDHSASLEPDGLRRLKRDLTNVSKALTEKETDMLEVEIETRNKLKWINR